MNRLQRLFGLGAPADADSVDPDTVVWVANLPLWQAPLIVAGLQEHDIVATFAEVSTARSSARADLYARQRDRAAAEAIVAKLTAQKSGSRARNRSNRD
jgi:hypothetical protein